MRFNNTLVRYALQKLVTVHLLQEITLFLVWGTKIYN